MRIKGDTIETGAEQANRREKKKRAKRPEKVRIGCERRQAER